MNRPFPLSPSTTLLVLGMAVAVGGCSSTSKGNNSGSSEGPTYVIQSWIDGPDSRTNYFNLVPASEMATNHLVSFESALEVGSNSRLFAPQMGGFFCIGNSEKLTITRYDIGPNGSIQEGATMSLQNQGLTDFQPFNYFISNEKAYLYNGAQANFIVWNPTTMTLTKTIPVPQTARSGLVAEMTNKYPVQRTGRLILPMMWNNSDGNVVSSDTGLLVMDTDNDTVASFTTDSRCPGANSMVVAKNGDAYMASSWYAIVSSDAVRGISRPACILRVAASDEAFDPSFKINMATATGEKAAYGISPSGDEGTVLISVLDESLVPWQPGLKTDPLWANVWQQWRLDLTTGTAVLTNAPLSTAPGNFVHTDDKTYIAEQTSDESAGKWFLLGPGGSLTPSIWVQGAAINLVRIR